MMLDMLSSGGGGSSSGLSGMIKGALNAGSVPEIFVPVMTILMIVVLVTYRSWTKPKVAAGLGLLFVVFYIWSATDPNFLKIIVKPDNVPITIMLVATALVTWVAFRQAAINDARLERGEPLIESGADDKVLVWPDLVYTELICLVLCSVALVVWAILLKAPLEPPANPTNIPNPSKAPWYFLGLQELLVYFDPWIAGVLLPTFIVIGLLALPYLDKNPLGNGYYTFKQRKFVIWMYMFGWVVLWLVLIVLGTFLRGPNWNIFGPYEPWDPHRPAALLNINVSDVFWVVLPEKTGLWKPGLPTEGIGPIPAYLIREAPGLALLGGYFFVLPVVLASTIFRKIYRDIGFIRYVIFWSIMSWMFIVPVKMVLRWLFNLKYFVSITELFLNI